MKFIFLDEFRWFYSFLYFDSRTRQLCNLVNRRRMGEIKFWNIDFEDVKFSLQNCGQEGIFKFVGVLNSPEWLISVTARHIARNPLSIKHEIAEYRLTGSNQKNSIVPDGLDEIEYLWWRLEHYFSITKDNSSYFTSEILRFAIDAAKLMWNPVEIDFDLIYPDNVYSLKKPLGMDKNNKSLVPWAPKGYSAPIELIAVRIKHGQVTENDWWEALADRVAELAMNEGEEVAEAACQALDVPMTSRIEEVGQSLVLYNSRLKTALNLAAYEGIPFPAIVYEYSQEAEDALEVTLIEWVDHALSMVSESSLD